MGLAALLPPTEEEENCASTACLRIVEGGEGTKLACEPNRLWTRSRTGEPAKMPEMREMLIFSVRIVQATVGYETEKMGGNFPFVVRGVQRATLDSAYK